MTSNNDKGSFIAMRTVPAILKNCHKQIVVNALLDDASTKSYLNADMAAELGLQGCTESDSERTIKNFRNKTSHCCTTECEWTYVEKRYSIHYQ